MTASAIFTAAHAAARLADAATSYRTRFVSALKSAWAAAKQTVQTAMSTVLSTITDKAGRIFDVFHIANRPADATPFGMPAVRTLFAVQQATAATPACVVVLSTYGAEGPAIQVDGATLHDLRYDGIRRIEQLETSRIQAAYGFSAADVAAFKQAANL